MLMVQSTTPLHLICWGHGLGYYMIFGACAGAGTSFGISAIVVIWCQWHHITQKSCCISIWLYGPKKCNGDVDDAMGII